MSICATEFEVLSSDFPGDLVTPVSAYLRLRPLGARFLLESVEGAERSSRFSFIGLGALARIEADASGTVCTTKDGRRVGIAGPNVDPLSAAVRVMNECRISSVAGPALLGGLVGYVGYEYVRHIERLGRAPDGRDVPELMFELVDEVLIFDHPRHRIALAKLAAPSAMAEGRRRLEKIVAALEGETPAEGLAATEPSFRPLMSDADYLENVRRLLGHVRAGDVFQAVLSREVEVHDSPDLFEVYRALRHVNPSPYMYHLDFGDVVVSGSSPETGVRLVGGRATLRPIAGTRPRGQDEQDDGRLEVELCQSRKERAEHAMLIDLARNDLARVAVPGSVHVTQMAEVERYSHVMHLVSEVEARLDRGSSAVELIRATFPAGTVSGAPKIRAMQLLDDYENTRRNLYAGFLGYIGRNGDMDMALLIRSAVYAAGRTTIRAGAGIVAGSTPEGELAECQAKLGALVAAIRSASGGSGGAGRGRVSSTPREVVGAPS